MLPPSLAGLAMALSSVSVVTSSLMLSTWSPKPDTTSSQLSSSSSSSSLLLNSRTKRRGGRSITRDESAAANDNGILNAAKTLVVQGIMNECAATAGGQC